MEKTLFLTEDGLRKLEEELDYLKTVKRKEMSEQIKVARSFGDLSENSEYDEAKNAQAIVEARIMEIEANLKHVKVVDEADLTTDRVGVGSKVTVHDLEFNEDDTYQIVGSSEIDVLATKISDESPIGKALLGRSAGETVEAETPNGVLRLKIVEISK